MPSRSPLMDTVLGNPVNLALVAGLAYYAYRVLVRSGSSWADAAAEDRARALAAAKPAEPLVIRNYTRKELAEFDGRDGKRIFIAVRGKVYDVTRGASFYGPGEAYGAFDASRGLAKHSFGPEVFTPLDQPMDPLDDLTEDEKSSLNDWIGLFESKYDHAGFLVEP
ncbi:Dihydrodipicolinate synthase [Blastocladiella emersonii ATCC 22665]|nr:Dihydrodipicolinate synthase [Blastocladiella emersonii ATCC 22665]